MLKFNQNSRTDNVIKTSFAGSVCNIFNILMGFIYRTVFLYFLSSSYLGINGLFSNILQILSFAELGITSAITYRFYQPISENDVKKVGQLMNFFRQVYRIIAIVIFVAGMALYPFLDYFVKDAGEVPSDVNLHFIYILFLLQSVTSYMFAYKQTLLSADQRQYILSFLQSGINVLRYGAQIVVLALWRNFTLTLVMNIVITMLLNYLISIWVTTGYREVFQEKDRLPREEQKQIFEDTKATLCHKIGATVLTSTDNIVLSSFVGLVATGIYSNYSLIISSLNGVLSQLLGSFTSTLGNAHIEQSQEEKYVTFRRLIFLNYWISGVFTVCLYNLLDHFITVWLGEDMLLGHAAVVILCVQFYFETARFIIISYISACGLFVKDKLRPLIESVINLVVSILLVLKIGIAGVFLGTIVSHLCTVFWREPYILFKFELKRSSAEYWRYYVTFFAITVMLAWGGSVLFSDFLVFPCNIWTWFLKAVILFLLSNIVLGICFFRNPEFLFYKDFLKGKWLRKG